MMEQEAILRLLVKKGIITLEECIAELNKVQIEMEEKKAEQIN